MDQVEFEPVQNWSTTVLKGDEPISEGISQSRCVADLMFQWKILTSCVPCVFS